MLTDVSTKKKQIKKNGLLREKYLKDPTDREYLLCNWSKKINKHFKQELLKPQI